MTDWNGQRPVYLAGSFSARAWIAERAAELKATGRFEITSRWLEGEPADWKEICLLDLFDVHRASLVIVFTEPASTRGGTHVELGFALGRGKDIIVIGPWPNPFYAHPGIVRYQDWPDFWNHEVEEAA